MKFAVLWKKPQHLSTKQRCFTYEVVPGLHPSPAASFSESSSYVLKAGDFLSK